jgi:hypothetical protein
MSSCFPHVTSLYEQNASYKFHMISKVVIYLKTERLKNMDIKQQFYILSCFGVKLCFF